VVVAAPVWTFWIAPILTIAALGVVIAVVAAYLRKVVAPKYPRQP
jgi:hypothetical protein